VSNNVKTEKTAVEMVNNAKANVVNMDNNAVRATFHNDWKEFLEVYADYVKNVKKFSTEVCYEYTRTVRKFLFSWDRRDWIEAIVESGDKVITLEIAEQLRETKVRPKPYIDWNNPTPLKKAITDYLAKIENRNTHRNTLASLKAMCELLGDKKLIEEKYKRALPSFLSIRVPSLEQIRAFDKALTHEEINLFYRLAIVSAVRPQHILRLTKKLFDLENRQINTWQKEYGRKNFFLSFWTPELDAQLKKHLATLKNDEPLFKLNYRYIQKVFERTSKKVGFQITPKTPRKFCTTWLLRHGMITQQVNILTSHMPQSIIESNYLDLTSDLKEQYDLATKDLRFEPLKDNLPFSLGKSEQKPIGHGKPLS
jgi:integrase